MLTAAAVIFCGSEISEWQLRDVLRRQVGNFAAR